MTKQATPRGTLTKNTQCQQRADDDAGEHRSDKRGDAPGEVVLKAMTFGRRSSGGGGIGDDGESDGHDGAPPTSPIRPRKTMSSGMLTDKPLISEPTAKNARPMKEHRLAAK